MAVPRSVRLSESGHWGDGKQLPGYQTADGRAGGEGPRSRDPAGQRRSTHRQGYARTIQYKYSFIIIVIIIIKKKVKEDAETASVRKETKYSALPSDYLFQLIASVR